MLADSPGPSPAPTSFATCTSCGSQTAYVPGTTMLRCGACGAEQAIVEAGTAIEEHSFDEWTARHGTVEVASLAAHTLQCRGCGATTETGDLATACQFCGGALLAVERPEGLVAPEAVLPFHVDGQGARSAFGTWVGSRWFAPNALKRVGSTEGLQGTYVPHWTFDAHTETDYDGQRGDHYYVTVSRTVTGSDGKSRTENVQERRTRWRSASGHVSRDFDDVLVVGSKALDPKKLAKMGPWRLEDARPYQAEFLTGYSALRYDVDPQTAAVEAREEMKEVIEDDCRRDIGGDEQRVSSMDVSYSQNMFKLVLVPLWIATYLYGGKTWQVMVNANTGEVCGDRPYSALKITAAVLVALLVLAVVAFLALG